jgi:hypothetical protein
MTHSPSDDSSSPDSLYDSDPHCKKRLIIIPSPAGMSLTKLSLAGNNYTLSGRELLIIPGQGELGQ